MDPSGLILIALGFLILVACFVTVKQGTITKEIDFAK